MSQRPNPGDGVDLRTPQEALEVIRANRPARTPEEVREQWNLIERAIALIDPSTDQLDAVLEVLNEIQQLIQEGELPEPPPAPEPEPGPAPPPRVPPGQLPDEVPPAFQDVPANVRQLRRDVADLLRGRIISTTLPIGRIGTSQDDLRQGQSGTGQFDILGMPFQVEVVASEAIDQFEKVVVTGSDNQVSPAPEEVQEAAGFDISGVGPRVGRSVEAGEENAVELDLGSLITAVDLFYEVQNTDGVLHIEHSRNGEDWRFFQDIDTSDTGIPREDTVQTETAFRFWRAWADDADFTDDDVVLLEASAKGL